MEKGKNNAAFKVAFITGATIFIMGYVNSMALHTEHLGLMVTPQTGNIVWLGMNPVFGEMGRWASNWLLFFGFVFGCGFAVVMNKKFENKRTQFFFNWSFFALPLVLYPFYAPAVNSQIAFLLMGLSAGFGVGFFRIMYHLDQINNAMATGSVRFIGVYFAEVFVKKNRKEMFTLWIFVLCVLLFALGGTVFAILHILNGGGMFEPTNLDVAGNTFSPINIALVIFCIIPCFFAPSPTGE